MGTTIATIDRAQMHDCSSFGNQEREMAETLSRCLPTFYRHAFSRMSTWLTTIVINSARMQLRRRARQTHVSLDERLDLGSYALSELLPDYRPSPAEQYLRSDLLENVLQLTRHLSPTLRTAFQLRHVDGLTIREMKDVLGVAEGTVKARVARARAKLRSLMRKRGQ